MIFIRKLRTDRHRDLTEVILTFTLISSSLRTPAFSFIDRGLPNDSNLAPIFQSTADPETVISLTSR